MLRKVVPRKFDTSSLASIQFICISAYSHDDSGLFWVLAQFGQLGEGYGMDVFRLVDGDEEDKGKLIEGLLAKEGVGCEKLLLQLVSLLDHAVLEEEIDEVREGEQPRPSGQDNDPSRPGVDQLESQASRLAELHVNVDEFCFFQGGGQLAIMVDLHHHRQVVALRTLHRLLNKRLFFVIS